MARLFSATLSVAICTELNAQQQESDFAAIAYSPLTRNIGIAQAQSSKAAAEAAAMQDCKSQQRSPADCQNAAWVQGGCAALAVSSKGAWGGHYAEDQSKARSNAIAKCQTYTKGADKASCAVLTIICVPRR
jgi:hypothetical protein